VSVLRPNLEMVAAEAESTLVEACRRGNRDAYRALFEHYKDRVYSIAHHYCCDRATAMDITQDVFVKLYSSLATFRAEASFDTWLYRLTVNRCLDHQRRFRRWLPLLDVVKDKLFAPDESLIDSAIRSELRGQLQAAVAKLPPPMRLVVVLRYTQDLSYEQIAEILGCSAGTVASRLNRAHKELARRLRKENPNV